MNEENDFLPVTYLLADSKLHIDLAGLSAFVWLFL